MATLRNIRNMIKVGIDEKHHNTVIRFLTNKVNLNTWTGRDVLACCPVFGIC